jgi:hypothetical protein
MKTDFIATSCSFTTRLKEIMLTVNNQNINLGIFKVQPKEVRIFVYSSKNTLSCFFKNNLGFFISWGYIKKN